MKRIYKTAIIIAVTAATLEYAYLNLTKSTGTYQIKKTVFESASGGRSDAKPTNSDDTPLSDGYWTRGKFNMK